jgi:hypothetical protein
VTLQNVSNLESTQTNTLVLFSPKSSMSTAMSS